MKSYWSEKQIKRGDFRFISGRDNLLFQEYWVNARKCNIKGVHKEKFKKCFQTQVCFFVCAVSWSGNRKNKIIKKKKHFSFFSAYFWDQEIHKKLPLSSMIEMIELDISE